jgi:hypothetical protein
VAAVSHSPSRSRSRPNTSRSDVSSAPVAVQPARFAAPKVYHLEDYRPDGIAVVFPKCTLFFEESFESEMELSFDAEQTGLDSPVTIKDIFISRGGVETPGLINYFSPGASLEKVKNGIRDLCTIVFTHFRPTLEGDFGWVEAYRAYLARKSS